MTEIVTKGQFAELSGVSAARVSQWISEGKISGDALVGEGRAARINVAVAQQQLRGRLDLTQRFSMNGLGTALGTETPAAPATAPAQAPASIDDRIRAERLAQEEMKTRRMTAEERESAGVYVRSADVSREMEKLAGGMLSTFEGALADFATDIAGEFALDQRAVVHTLRGAFRRFRERSASTAAANAAAMPATSPDLVTP